MLRPLLLLLLLLTASLPATAKVPVTGRIADGDTPVAYATVVLLRGGSQHAGTTADAEGCFRLLADTGAYRLTLRHVGCLPFEQEIQVGTQGTDLGTLLLRTEKIRTVTITAEAVRRENDRFVVEVGDTPSLAGRDGEELLTLAPGVWIGDNGISINGAAGAQVYVDGRELKGSAEETGAYLRSLTAADIARIEVVPQTGAEFAADARGGAVLITLRRRRNDGLDGNMQFSIRQSAHLSAYTPSARLSAHAGRWTLSAAGSGNLAPQTGNRFEESRAYASQHLPFAGTTSTEGRSGYGRGQFSAVYDPSPRHTLGASAEYISQSYRMPTEARTVVGDAVSDSRYRRHTAGSTLTAAMNYIWRIDTLGSQLKLLADYTRHGTDGDNNYHTTVTTPGTVRDSLCRSADRSRYDMLTAELALTLKLRHGLRLNTGVRYTRNGMDDRSRYEVSRQPVWQELPDYGYMRRHTEQTGAAYASLGLTTGRWELSAGLRGEYTSVRSRDLRRNYFSLFPSLSVNRALNDLRTWLLIAQWSRNIERPSFPALNPSRMQLSDFSYQTGNPSLRPTYIHRMSLTVVWRYRYTLTVGGNLHHDLIREAASTDPANPDVVAIRPENHHTENHWFAALSAPLQLTSRWRLSLNAVGVAQRIRLDRGDAPSTHGLLFADATTAFTLPGEFYIEAVYRVQSRLYSGNSEVGPRHTLSATVKKRLCKKQLTLFFTAQNLTASGWEFVSATDGLRRVLRGRQAGSGRVWKIGATWSFRTGKQFRTREVESASGAERTRLSKTNRQSK